MLILLMKLLKLMRWMELTDREATLKQEKIFTIFDSTSKHKGETCTRGEHERGGKKKREE